MEQLPSTPIITEDQVTYPEPCGGCELVSAYGYPSFFNMVSGEEVNTWQIEFWALGRLDQERVHGFMDEMARRMAGGLVFEIPPFPPIVVVPPIEMLAYFVYERQGFGLQVPTEFCIPAPVIGQWCFTPPFAGQTIAEGYFYRLWIVTRDIPVAAQVAPGLVAMGAWPTAGVILALAVAFLMVVGSIVVIVGVIAGRSYIDDVVRYTKTVIEAPGENVSKALTTPLIAFGFTLIAAGIFLPMLMTKLSVEAPIGPARVKGELATGPRVTGTAPRRRR